jgi:GMP synthase (glutamine-hydrolysing)
MTRLLVVEHEADAGTGLVGERIAHAGAQMVVVGPETGREVPRSADGYDGVIVLGGSPSPTDESVTWFADVRALIQDCLDRSVALLGVCLGAQLLGLVAGGRTSLLPGGPEIGLCTLQPTEAAVGDPLLGDLPAQTRSLEWHFYEVDQLPVGSTSLVYSDRCANQAFRVGRHAWGLQFHLEALPSTAEAWSRGQDQVLAAAGTTGEQLVTSIRHAEPELRATWSDVADRWLGVCRGVRLNDASGPPTGPAGSG